ncbi:MAG: isoaspartyl peptidase/L-asparaginase [Alphaproteobacteria bacterium]|nr:isoaspartyl peptidase/L-asparaginase [Alphaproteobacteria bacterium]
MPADFALALHGGAGTILESALTPAKEAEYHASLARPLRAGHRVLADGGSALDAVTAAVCALEDEPLFNAGRGSVFTSTGKQEMDASIMDGSDRRVGAVAGIFGPRNPILVARAVMERTPYVTMIGTGAEALARSAGLPFEGPEYFFTEQRWKAMQETLAQQARGAEDRDEQRRHGTVGAVARDRRGNLAAATSTGGMSAKLSGRVGDSPVIGAGTFAENGSCAISCTGHGEVFIRWVAAHEISARMRHLGECLVDACEHVVMKDLKPNDGSGGLVAVDADGTIAMPFNSAGMYRGRIGPDGVALTAIHRETLRAS